MTTTKLPANLYERGLNQPNAPADYNAEYAYAYPGGAGVMPKYGGGTMLGPGGEQTKNWDVNPMWKPEYDAIAQQQGSQAVNANLYSQGTPATPQQISASPVDKFAAAPGQVLHDSLGNPFGGEKPPGGENPQYPYYGPTGEPYSGKGNSFWFNEADGIMVHGRAWREDYAAKFHRTVPY